MIPPTWFPESSPPTAPPLVYANADVTPYARRRDNAVEVKIGKAIQNWWGNLMHPPGSVTTKSGHTSRIFTPFFVKWRDLAPTPWPAPRPVKIERDPGEGLPTETRNLPRRRRTSCYAAPLRLRREGRRVRRTRDRPDFSGTSHLSTDLHFGVLTPRTIAACGRHLHRRACLFHAPTGLAGLVRPPTLGNALIDARHRCEHELTDIAWQNDPADIEGWQKGLTGYPFVDAGMRQLERTGWMHNRVRMVVASFLVKDLLVDWRIGERWFRRLLVDGDVAQNAGNWQWVAGTGPDAAPYYRVFNPVLQSRKFDPDGSYIKNWVPELSSLPPKWIHEPWTAPTGELALLGVKLGDTYPYPIIDHPFARDRALAIHAATRRAAME